MLVFLASIALHLLHFSGPAVADLSYKTDAALTLSPRYLVETVTTQAQNLPDRALELFFAPGQTALMLLLVAVTAAIGVYSGQVFSDCISRHHGPADVPRKTYLPMVVALAAGAALPPVMDRANLAGAGTMPIIAALCLSAVMMAGGLLALSLEQLRAKRAKTRVKTPVFSALGLFSGWSVVVFMAALSDVMMLWGMGPLPATMAVVGLIVVLSMVVQLHLGPSPSFSGAIIWSLMGIAGATMETAPMIASVAILGMTFIALILVAAAS